MLRVDFENRLRHRRLLAGRLEDAGEVAGNIVLVGDQTGRAIGQAIDLVIHIARTPGGRRVSELMRVTGWGEGGYVVQAG